MVMRKIWNLVGIMLVMMLVMLVSSCDDLFGEQDKPTPTEETTPQPPAQSISFAESEKWWGTKDGKFTLVVTNTGDGVVTYSSSDPSVASVDPTTGEVTPGDVAATDVVPVVITATVADSENATYPTKTAQYTLKVGKGYRYLIWDDTNKKLVYDIDDPASDNDFIDSSTGAAAKLVSGGAVKFVKGHVTISGGVTIGNDLLLVLLDDAELDINGQFGNTTYKVLSISAQSEGDKKGKMVVVNNANTNTGTAIICRKGMNIYGGKITAEVTMGINGGHGINVDNYPLNIYGGDVTAKAGNIMISSSGYHGISGTSAKVLITGRAILTATGGNSSSGWAGCGIYADVTVSGEAKFTAIGGTGNPNGHGMSGTLTNESSAPVVFETSSDGATWDGSYTLSAGSSARIGSTAALQKRGVRKM